MKQVEVVSKGSVKVSPFILDEFIPRHTTTAKEKKISKKALKKLADELGLDYDESKISFSKKIINAYIKKS
jgi:hypothetical protein